MLGRLFKRKKRVTDPTEVAERERQRRGAQTARWEAEAKMAQQRAQIESATWIDSGPPSFGP